MIGIVTEMAEGICRHCGGRILLLQNDLEREPRWAHDAVKGVFRAECPGTVYAEPIEGNQ